MSIQIRLLVGGLPKGAAARDVAPLLAPYTESRFELLDLPDPQGQSMAVLQLGSDAALAGRLRQRLERRRVGGRRLWTWLTVMPWS